MNAFTGKRPAPDQDAVVVNQAEAHMILNTRQQIATAFLAVLIVASVMAMPRGLDSSRDARSPARSSGTVVAAPTVTAELSSEQVKDLTYN